MSDTFLPGSGFDTYESQDKVLVQMDGSRECAVAGAHFTAAGFAVVGAVVRLPRSSAKPLREPKRPPRRWGSSASC